MTLFRNTQACCWLVALAMLGTFETAAGQQAEKKNRDLFKFCGPTETMGVYISPLPEFGPPSGLRRETIQNAVESRLRGARIYHDAETGPLLAFRFILGEPLEKTKHFQFFSSVLAYHRFLPDPVFDTFHLTQTWSSMQAGQGDAQLFLAGLNEQIDEFIVEYLRVRESEACRDLWK